MHILLIKIHLYYCRTLYREHLHDVESSAPSAADVKAVEEEEEGVWVEGERSEGELGDDSDDTVQQTRNKIERTEGDREQFGPREDKRCTSHT